MGVKTETAVFGGGCFWCTEAVFEQLRGVVWVMPGYAEGAEVIKIEFDPAQITYKALLTVFFATHDPTTLNRQGADVGTEYRSLILYANEEQKRQAENYITELNKEITVVTKLQPLEKFYEAEEENKQYYQKNLGSPYCQIVINPKIEKVQKQFAHLLKSHGKQ